LRYFRYKKIYENEKNAYKEQYKILPEDEKRIVKKEKMWKKIAKIVFFVIYIFFMAFGIFLLKFIHVSIIVKVISTLVLMIACCVLTAKITASLWKKAASFNVPKMKKEAFSKACGHLREYYQLKEPYIITKCFDATDETFKNHDVCIFVAEDELRITTDLVKGFLYGERDLGCYAFKRDEIIMSKLQNDNRLMLELKADNDIFVLGYSAKRFIDKNFIEKESE
jgi:uncharacterized membrane protein (DUF485 family)